MDKRTVINIALILSGIICLVALIISFAPISNFQSDAVFYVSAASVGFLEYLKRRLDHNEKEMTFIQKYLLVTLLIEGLSSLFQLMGYPV